MKKIFNIILTCLTIALLGFMIFNGLNDIAKWVDLSPHKWLIDYIVNYGPVILMCLFAFGKILGKMFWSKILFIVVLILLVVFTILTFAPDWVVSIFGWV